MMLPTHVLVGVALAAPLALLAPELGTFALLGAIVGSVLPDLDMYAGHRRTLHFPTLYPAAALPAILVALFVPTPVTVGVALALLGAAVHCQMDVYGGGLELRPWEGNSDRAVYDHVGRTWIAPKRWLDYDGSPGDFALAAGIGVPLLFVLEGPFPTFVAAALVVAAVYALLRRHLVDLAPVVFGAVPEPLQSRVPARYRE